MSDFTHLVNNLRHMAKTNRGDTRSDLMFEAANAIVELIRMDKASHHLIEQQFTLVNQMYERNSKLMNELEELKFNSR